MPEITLITAISVVVARMMPSRVRKLRSLLPRSEWRAPFTASQNDACEFMCTLDASHRGLLAAAVLYPLHYGVIQPETVGTPAKEAEVPAAVGDHPLDGGVSAGGGGFVNGERDERVVLGLN